MVQGHKSEGFELRVDGFHSRACEFRAINFRGQDPTSGLGIAALVFLRRWKGLPPIGC